MDENELKYIVNEVYSWFTVNDEYLTKNEYNEYKTMLKETILTFYPHLAYSIEYLDDALNVEYKITDINYQYIENKINNFEFQKDFITCEERDYYYDTNRNNNKLITNLNDKEKELFNQYEYLINLPQPVQKSKEWFDMRNNMVTASNCGAVIGECKYQSIKQTLIDKIGLGEKFKENKFVYHGKKYEKVAIMIYEIIYNSKVGEFGLIQHPTISYLGASPDGISMSLTLDGKINKYLGRMLEIKCPPARKIINYGKIKGNICPDYYWVQVQIQLECCNLPECDFWQCHLVEYNNESEFNNDLVDDLVHTDSEIFNQDINTEIENEPEPKYIDKRIRKGAIIELLPIDRSKIPKNELVEWYGKYIYPPTILMTPSEYKIWTTNTINNLDKLYPELTNEYKFSKVVYWKLENSHNELITRQIEWFDKYKNQFEKFWNRVLYYRNRLDEAKEDLIDQRLINELFLVSDELKIPKFKSMSSYNKQLLNESNSVFIKPKITSKDDLFLSSDAPKNIEISKKKIQKDDLFLSSNASKKKIQKDDLFLSSDAPKNIEVSKKKIQKDDLENNNLTSKINNDDNENLDLVFVTENRKKKNIKNKIK